MVPQQQPNPFDPSPKPEGSPRSPQSVTRWLAPLSLLAAAVVLAAIGTSRDDQGLRIGAGVLAVLGLIILGGALLSSRGTASAQWTIRLPSSANPPGSSFEANIEDQPRQQLEGSGMHLTDEQVREAIEHGSVVTSSVTYRAGSGKIGDPAGMKLFVDGKTIDPAAILATGASASATIEGFEHQIGASVPASMGDLFLLTLAISQPGGEPRRVITISSVPSEHRHLLSPGTAIPVKVSRDDPDLVAVDWQRVT